VAGSVSIGSLFATLEVRDVSGAVRSNFQRQIKEIETSTVRASRTTKSETDKISEAYRKVVASLDPVVARTQRYERQLETLNSALKAGVISQAQYNHQLALAQSKLEVTTHWTSRLGQSIGSELVGNFGRFLAVSTLVTVGLGALVSVGKQYVQANIEAEVSQRKVEESVRRYGTASGVTVKQIDSLAQSTSRLTGIDDELIADAQTIGLRYNRISTEIFPRFTRAAIDLSVATGADLSSAFEKAGRIVNQPLRGLTLLSREGYAVSKSQSDMVKSMVASGDIMGAQSVMLGILEAQYKGAAEAARDTMGGALKALGTTWENFLERVGQDNMGPLRQALEDTISLLESATDRVRDFEIGWHKSGAAILGIVNQIVAHLGMLATIGEKLHVPGAGVAIEGLERVLAGQRESINNHNKQVSLSLLRAGLEQGTLTKEVYIKTLGGLVKSGVLKAGKELSELLSLISDEHGKGARSALEQTDAENKLSEALDRSRQMALDAVAASALLRQNAEALFQARRIGVDAMKLEEGIQRALTRARAAGEGASSSQRLEIIRNSLATDIAKNKTDALALAQKNLAEGFKLVEDEIKKVTDMLDNLVKMLDQMDVSAIEFSVGINRQQVSEGGQQATNITQERLNTAREWRESWRTAREVADAEIARVGDSLLTLAEKEWAITEIRIGLVEHYADAWVSFFNFLGGMFDGVIAQIANAFSQLQSAYQSFSGLGKSMGLDASAASGLGIFGVFVAVVDIAHGLLEAHKQNQRNRQWSLSAQALGTPDRYGLGSFQIGAAQDAHLNVSKASRDASNAINTAMEEIAEAIGGVLKTFEDITINIRRDGKYFQALVGQQIIGIYESFEAAMEAALQASLLAADTIITGLSDLVQQGLAELRSRAIGKTSDLNQIVDFLSALKEISELGLPQGAIQMQELTRHFDELWNQLQRMNEITPAVSEGFTNLIQAEVSAWQEWSRNIRGVEQTRAELLVEKQREAVLFNASKKLRIAELELKVLELKADAERTRARGEIVRGGALINQGEIDTGVAYIQAKSTLVKADAEITNSYIAFIEAVIKAIEEVIAAIAAIPDINIGDIKLPRVGGAGGGSRDSLSDMIADSRRQISQAGLPEWQRQIADVNQRWDEAIKGLGNLSEAEARARRQRDESIKSAKGNEEAIRKANEAYERQIRNINATREEIEAANRQREAEIRLIEEQARKDITGNFREFLGLVTPFDQVRQTATELIKQIETGPFGDARKAAMVARVLAELDEQITKLSMQEAGSLLGDLAGSLEKFGIDSQLQSQLRMNAAIIEHQLNLQNYRERIALLKAEGKIPVEIIADMEAALRGLEAVNVRAALIDDGRRFRGYEDEANRLESSIERVNSELNHLAESFARAKDSIRSTLDDISRGEFGIVAPEQAFEAARAQFEGMLGSARAGELIGFEEADSTTREYIEALKRFSPQLAATELPRIQEELRSLLNIQTVRDENLVYSERFAVGQEAANKTLVAGFNDLSNKSQEQSIIQARMLEQIRQLNESNAELNSKLARLEASQQANKRAA
jgi:hypothetical protein